MPSRLVGFFPVHKQMEKICRNKGFLVDNKEWGDKISEDSSKIRDAADEIVVPQTEKRMGVINEPVAMPVVLVTGTWRKVGKWELLGQNLRVDI